MKTARTRNPRLFLSLGLALVAGAAQAAGPLYLSDDSGELKPLAWDMANGPIPIYTDGGEAFTFDFDGVTPFITIERANEITAFAFQQWSQVPTSTFEAEIAGTIESQIGIPDITGANADAVYSVENGRGFWVLYDTDGSILQDYFGVSRDSVLGIAFPEWSDGNGHIIEATAVMNGWGVHVDDPQGNAFAGVFSHEFGHALNLSHSQVNGPMAYQSYTYAPKYPGVKGCVAPYHRYDYPSSIAEANPIDVTSLETMFPFIDSRAGGGVAQSTVDMPDDIAGISNLYPSATYASTTGSISGVLRLKDGATEYSGVNVIARNVDDPLFDAVSAMTGDQTQGELGPDGRFTIRNLTPGQRYVVYIEPITSGGYPTTPRALVSQGEYWNVAEGSDPATDAGCDATPILAEAGVTRSADITFNGYAKGVQFTPIVQAHLLEVAKSGKRASGVVGDVGFVWDRTKGFQLLPEGVGASNGALDRNGGRMLGSADVSGNGIKEPVIVSLATGRYQALGDINGNTCGGSGTGGVSAATGWSLDDAARTMVGTGYVDRDGNGVCQQAYRNEIVPVVWDAQGGMRELHTWFDALPQWSRATGISGNGRVIVGSAGLQDALAWIDEGQMINLGDITGARDLYAVNYDGSRVPMSTQQGVLLWNAMKGTGADAFTNIGGLRYCRDIPLVQLGRDVCALYGEDYVHEALGYPLLSISSTTDKGDIVLGRAGSLFTGFVGAIWIEHVGWMTMIDFLHKQGVVEATDVPYDNPIGISASGSEIVGGLAGATMSWLIEADQVYVCQDGQSVLTGFPGGLQAKVQAGATFGRCEFLD